MIFILSKIKSITIEDYKPLYVGLQKLFSIKVLKNWFNTFTSLTLFSYWWSITLSLLKSVSSLPLTRMCCRITLLIQPLRPSLAQTLNFCSFSIHTAFKILSLPFNLLSVNMISKILRITCLWMSATFIYLSSLTN